MATTYFSNEHSRKRTGIDKTSVAAMKEALYRVFKGGWSVNRAAAEFKNHI